MSSYGQNNSSQPNGPQKIYGGVGSTPTKMESAIPEDERKDKDTWVHPFTKFFRLFKKKKSE